MKYKISTSKKYKRDLRKMLRRGYDMKKMEAVVGMLASGVSLPREYHDHQLHGAWEGLRECHVSPDWLLV